MDSERTARSRDDLEESAAVKIKMTPEKKVERHELPG
jgi:hypothetical protein